MKRFVASLLFLVVCLPAWALPSDSVFSFISFNVRLGSEWSRQFDGPHHWDFRKGAVLRMIDEERPDALGMQEVLPNQLQFLDSALSDYVRIGVGREDGDKEGECMAVFVKRSRFEVLRTQTFWLSETPTVVGKGWDAACHRTVTMVLLRDRLSGRTLLYMNTHLDHMGAVARTESVKLLVRLAKEWAPDGMPCIIGGDMNSEVKDPIFLPLFDNGFAEARRLAPRSDDGPTYNAFGKDKASTIDHFFVSGISVLEMVTLTRDFGVPYISDHYPVRMRFTL